MGMLSVQQQVDALGMCVGKLVSCKVYVGVLGTFILTFLFGM